MNKRFHPIIAFLILALAMLACTLPLGNSPTTPDQVSTAIALTMQALTPVNDGVATPALEESGVLPHSLYLMNNDSTGNAQVFRLGKDGKTLTQITSESSAVHSYDVSPVDGNVAYVANNQLLLIHADGSGRRMLVDGGPVDPNDPFINSLTSPVFSPDGQTIAFSQQGLVLYSLTTGTSNMVLQEMTTDPVTGASVPSRVFIPQEYSPDGTKLVVTAAIPRSDGFSTAIYSIASDTNLDVTGTEGARLCCSQQAWTADSSALFVANPTMGMFSSGLWRIDAATGNTATLIPAEAGGGNYNLADEPYLAPDGQLYFFYATAAGSDGFIMNAPLQMVRSAPDGITSRTALRPDTFTRMNEALWAPDASFVIVANAPSDSVYAGGQLDLYYTDASQPVINLLPFAQQMKWGP